MKLLWSRMKINNCSPGTHVNVWDRLGWTDSMSDNRVMLGLYSTFPGRQALMREK